MDLTMWISSTVPARPLAGRASNQRRLELSVTARFSSSSSNNRSFSPSVLERVISCVPYLLPFFDAFMYGIYLFRMFPVMRMCMAPILPALSAYHSTPFAAFIAFFAVYLGIVNNKNLSRFVRFNGMQAALLDIVLVLPRLLESVFTPPNAGWGAQAYIYSQSFIWIFVTAWVVYGVASALLGVQGRIPFIADAADAQIR
ncbi:MAG: hypothetical protein WDW38_011050 [Sanguina aurantia]